MASEKASTLTAERVGRRDTRPLLRGRDARETLRTLAEARYPIYATADVTVDVGEGVHAQGVEAILAALTSIGAVEAGA